MSRLDSVHKLAERKIRQWGLTPPINIEEVIRSHNIEIVEAENQYGIEAYSELGLNPRIVINPEKTSYSRRRNFTLAHELGHICIPWHNGDLKCNFEDNYINVGGRRLLDTQELEANIFASDFLMPQAWLTSEIESNGELPFDELVRLISNKANTSIMACLYALERVLPSGYTYFVKKDTSEWWSFFASRNTYTINWFSYQEDKMDFFESLSIGKEKFEIGPYKIVLYRMIPCPSRTELRIELGKSGRNIETLIAWITKGYRLRILPFLDVVLDVISDNGYIAFLFHENELERTFYSEDSPLRRINGLRGYESVRETVALRGFEFQSIDLGYDMILLYISGKTFEMPSYPFTDPNILLRTICDSYGFDTCMLQSINGVMSAANSMYGNEYSDEELYNWCKIKFITDPQYNKIADDVDFDKYIVNKLKSMASKRRKK